MNRLNFALRWIGTAISFAVFGIGGLLQGILIHPLRLKDFQSKLESIQDAHNDDMGKFQGGQFLSNFAVNYFLSRLVASYMEEKPNFLVLWSNETRNKFGCQGHSAFILPCIISLVPF